MEDTDPQEVPVSPRPKFRLSSVVLVAMLVLVDVAFVYSAFFSKFPVPTQTNQDKPVPQIEVPNPNYPTQVDLRWMLVHSGKEVATISANGNVNAHAKWQKLIFYAGGKSTETLNMFDLATDTDSIVFEATKSAGLRYPGQSGVGIVNMAVIENTLYFSVGGYLTGGATYWVDLPIRDKPHVLAETGFGDVKKLGNHYFLTDGFGDGCGGWFSYSLLNTINKTTQFVFKANSGCNNGERMLGLDLQDRILLAGYVPKDAKDVSGPSIDSYVIAHRLSGDFGSQGIIAKEQMPKDVSSTVYLPERNILVLINDSAVYKFDLAANVMSKVLDWDSKNPDGYAISDFTLQNVEGGNVCLRTNGQYSALIDLDNKKLVKYFPTCMEKTGAPYLSTSPGVEDLTKDLNLPSDYYLVRK